jgi:type I restriction enzyme S subunit
MECAYIFGGPMSFPRYPKYKPSGVEWLGEVPEHWSLTKIRHAARIVGGGTPSRENATYWNGNIPWVSPKDMKSESIDDSEERITEIGLKSSSTTLIPAGGVLMVKGVFVGDH